MRGLQTTVQELGWFQELWDVELPDNYEDDLRLQPFGVHSYKETIEANYGQIPADRDDLWRVRRNYLINCCGSSTRNSRRSSMRWTHVVYVRTRL